jgi:hypothetical protein
MTDSELADLVIARLNEIHSHDPEALKALISSRVPCNEALANHPSVQVGIHDGVTKVGLLGIINGIVGTIPEGEKAGWGYVAAVFDDDEKTLTGFRRTDHPEVRPEGEA